MAAKRFLDVRIEKVSGAVATMISGDPKQIEKLILWDKPAFDEIGKRILSSIQAHYMSAFKNTEATTERKGMGSIQRKGNHGASGSSVRPGFSSGETYGDIAANSKEKWAGVWVGGEEWYSFLHDYGVGYAFWSVNPRPNRKANPKTRAEHRASEAQGGTTKFRPAPFMLIDSGTETWVVERIGQSIQDALDRGGNGSSAG